MPLEEESSEIFSGELKNGLAEMLSGGVIFDVTTPEEAKIAQEAGAKAVSVGDEENAAGVMSSPETIQSIQEVITIPIIAKCRIGHFAEAQILESLFVDFIDESDVLLVADKEHYINKAEFRTPFISGCENMETALKRIAEGTSILRTQTLSISDTIRTLRFLRAGIRNLIGMDESELLAESVNLNAQFDILCEIAYEGKLPIPIFAAGGIHTPADASLVTQLGADSVIISREIFRWSKDPLNAAKAIVGAVSNYKDPEILTKATLGDVDEIKSNENSGYHREDVFNTRGW